jgi:AcrR family transcriptional regulator
MPRLKLKPTDRKQQILTAAISLAVKDGYQKVTREAIAEAALCSPGLVSNYFNTMTQCRRAIMRAAIKDRNLTIIAQGVVAKDKDALKAPTELQEAALKSLTA